MEIAAEEELLLSRAVRLDPAALQNLADQHASSFYGFLLHVFLGDADLARETLVRAWAETLKSFAPFEEKVPFPVALAFHALADIKEPASKKSRPGFPGPEATREPRLRLIFEALPRLPLEKRILLLLRDQLDFSLEELSFVLSLSEDQLRHRLKEARLALRLEVEHLLPQKKA